MVSNRFAKLVPRKGKRVRYSPFPLEHNRTVRKLLGKQSRLITFAGSSPVCSVIINREGFYMTSEPLKLKPLTTEPDTTKPPWPNDPWQSNKEMEESISNSPVIPTPEADEAPPVK